MLEPLEGDDGGKKLWKKSMAELGGILGFFAYILCVPHTHLYQVSLAGFFRILLEFLGMIILGAILGWLFGALTHFFGGSVGHGH